jgi:phosphoglycerate dehydrogenase-like enzyme
MTAKPVVLLKPAPQLRDRIFSPASLGRLRDTFEVIDLEAEPEEQLFMEKLPEAFAIIGQPDLDAASLNRAKSLKALINVEGNFFPNVDYPTAFRNGVRVLGCGTAYSQAVAEYSLGLALDLARGISREDHAARNRSEHYVSASNADAILLQHASVGLVGFGNLGRSLHRLIQPFQNHVRVFDPWLPEAVLRDAGVTPSSLEETLTESRFVFVFATATDESRHLLDAAALDLLRDDVRLILVSRAAVVDYEALLERVAAGRFYVGIDVWPIEPLPRDSPFRDLDNVVLSAHRAGGIPEAFYSIGDMVNDDLELMLHGLPPVRLQQAAPELVGRYRNKPVA